VRVLSDLRAQPTLLIPVPIPLRLAGAQQTLLAQRSEPQPGPENALLGQELLIRLGTVRA
jgi:hypothetical protein